MNFEGKGAYEWPVKVACNHPHNDLTWIPYARLVSTCGTDYISNKNKKK